MQASFYVLNPHKVQDDQTILDFVCRLIQTVLRKSEQSLVVVDNDNTRLDLLDKHLWVFEATSFIPHQLSISSANNDVAPSDSTENETTTAQINTHTSTHTSEQEILSPVLLTDTFPTHFDGIILNLSPSAIPLSDTLVPERILEIITPSSDSQEHGRNKYKQYRDLGLSLNHFKL